jgi:hypothetical protein
MWAFLSRRFRQFLLLAIGLPVLAWALERSGERMAERRGDTDLSRGLRRGGEWLHRYERGPFARKPDAA